MWGFLWWFTRLVSKKKGTKKEDSVMDRGQQVCDLQKVSWEREGSRRHSESRVRL